MTQRILLRVLGLLEKENSLKNLPKSLLGWYKRWTWSRLKRKNQKVVVSHIRIIIMNRLSGYK